MEVFKTQFVENMRRYQRKNLDDEKDIDGNEKRLWEENRATRTFAYCTKHDYLDVDNFKPYSYKMSIEPT